MGTGAQPLEIEPPLDARRGSEGDEGQRGLARQCLFDPVTYQTTLLLVISALLYADQNLMAPNLTQIAEDFGLTPVQRDRELAGYSALGFFSVGALSSFAGGYLADRCNRIYSMAGVVVVGEAACLGTFFVQSLEGFILARSLTGVSVGASLPLLFSLIGDLYHTRNVGKTSALASIGMALGVGMGQIVAGLVGPTFGWRLPFLLVSVPALALVVLLVATTTEPERGRREQVFDGVAHRDDFEYTEKMSCAKLGQLFRVPSVALLVLQGLPSSVPWGVITAYFNDFIAQELNIRVELATAFVLVFGGGVLLGQFFGGWLTDRWLREQTAALALTASASCVLGAVPLITILFERSWPLWAYIMTAFPAGFLCGIPGSVSRGLLVCVTAPELRGSAFAVSNLADDVAKGMGVYLVSLLIGLFPEDRAKGLAISFAFWGIAALVLLPLVWTYRRDLASTEERMVVDYLRGRPDHQDLVLREQGLLLPEDAAPMAPELALQ